MKIKLVVFYIFLSILCCPVHAQQGWTSKFVGVNADGSLHYIPDEKGNIIPDFSMVGYYAGARPIPDVPVVITVEPSGNNSQNIIQKAIDELSKKPLNTAGFRGAILLKKGIYQIPGSININTSGIVLRGEGSATKLIATGKGQRSLIMVSGEGSIEEVAGTRKKIMDAYVPVGTKTLTLQNTTGLSVGDKIVVYRPATQSWLTSIKMDEIEMRDSTVKQWTIPEYNFQFERVVEAIAGNSIVLNAPIVMEMNADKASAEIFTYRFKGRINNCAVENLSCDSEFDNETDEDHGWNAVHFNKIDNGWVRNITSTHFGYSCVNLDVYATHITVIDCKSYSPVSQITGGRRYSFNNNGQLNLFMNCFASNGRHDYVTGSRVCGPNVFYNCIAENTHADIGPHHRWAMGTLFDNIVTDGEINVQDRGNWGTGHGWAGVNQVLWNCTVSKAAVQNPWTSGKNYAIGLKGEKVTGRLKGRPEGEWEGQNKPGLTPGSLYLAQLKDAHKTLPISTAAKNASFFYNETVATLYELVLKQAAWAMNEPIATITKFQAERSAGGLHDFYSEGDYWWPDPNHPDSPYIQKDGMTNPANFTMHREAMIQFSRIVAALASAYKLTGNEEYATRILQHCKAWFVDEATFMNPSMLYAQAIKGRATGRGIGIIDTIHLMEVVKALEAIRSSGMADKNLYAAIKAWFEKYVRWLNTHPYGRDEMMAKNNHGTCWVMQVAVFAKFIGEQNVVAFCSDRYKNVLLPQQMKENGSFPLELSRTKPYGYSLFNLDAMTTICQELSTADNNLWNFSLPDGRNIRDAVLFHYPYIDHKENWPFARDVMYWDEWPVAQPALLFAANAYGNRSWLQTWKALSHEPVNKEVIRNLPVRNPLLWLEN